MFFSELRTINKPDLPGDHCSNVWHKVIGFLCDNCISAHSPQGQTGFLQLLHFLPPVQKKKKTHVGLPCVRNLLCPGDSTVFVKQKAFFFLYLIPWFLIILFHQEFNKTCLRRPCTFSFIIQIEVVARVSLSVTNCCALGFPQSESRTLSLCGHRTHQHYTRCLSIKQQLTNKTDI